MKCCDPKDVEQSSDIRPSGVCSACKVKGSSVSIRTLFHHLKPNSLETINEQEYWFCGSDQCPIVYFSNEGAKFTEENLREFTWLKNTNEKARTVCHCFGYSADQVLIPSFQAAVKIRDYIRRRFCQCEIRNPSGQCCLSVVLSLGS